LERFRAAPPPRAKLVVPCSPPECSTTRWGAGARASDRQSEWHAPAKCEYDAPPRPQCAQQLTAPCAAIRTIPRRTSAARKIRLSMQSDGMARAGEVRLRCATTPTMRTTAHRPMRSKVRTTTRWGAGARVSDQKSEWHAPAKCDYDAPPRPQCAQQLPAPKCARFRDAPSPRRKIRLGDCALLPRKSKMWFCSLCGC
jgi:hypothetical protein